MTSPAAVAPHPPYAPLPMDHARATRRAGALGSAFVGVGLSLAFSPLVAWGITALYAWSARMQSTSSDVEPEVVAVFQRMLDLLASPLAIVGAIVCALGGSALVALGIVTSVRRLRRAGVRRPVAVVLLGLLLARVGTWIVGSFLGGIGELLTIAWFPPLVGIAISDVIGDDLDGVPVVPATIVAGILLVLVGAVLTAGIWLGIGLLTTWWMAIAMRERISAMPFHPMPWQPGPWQSGPWQEAPAGAGLAPTAAQPQPYRP